MADLLLFLCFIETFVSGLWRSCSMSAKKNTEEEDAGDGGEKLHYISVIKKLSF